jgi:UDP-N-acetylenolpyruvoylglucosamine reductase
LLPASAAQLDATKRASAADAAALDLLNETATNLLRLLPENATSLGVDRGTDARLRSRLADRSVAGQQAIAARLRRDLARVQAIDLTPLSHPVRTSVEVVRSAYATSLEGFALPYGDITVGGWRNTPYVVIQNVGAYGQEVAHTITRVRALDRRAGQVIELTAAECAFTYRGSAFKESPDRWVVLDVAFRLVTDVESEVRYSQLADALGQQIGEPAGAQRVREAVLALRRAKGMVLDPRDPDASSAGSFFTNPIVSDLVADSLPAECPRYPAVAGVKVSAAWLIEHSGVTRGWRARAGSRAAVSTKHSLAISNRGGATAAEVIELARSVRERVHAAYGVELTAEPRLVNCSLGPIEG